MLKAISRAQGLFILLASAACAASACTSTDAADTTGAGGSAGSGTASGGSSGTSTTTDSGASGGSSTGDAAAGPLACSDGTVATGHCPLIDDLEDGNASLIAADGRAGSWYSFDDKTGTVMPASTVDPMVLKAEALWSGDRSKYAMHTVGTGHTDFGGGLGFGMGAGTCYNAVAYDGMSFWAKGVDTKLWVTVAVPETRKKENGGVCEGMGCGDDFGYAVVLTAEWKQYNFKWSQLTQMGWGTKAVFHAGEITGVDFRVASDAKPYGWDFWVDDVSFTGGMPTTTGCSGAAAGDGGASSGDSSAGSDAPAE